MIAAFLAAAAQAAQPACPAAGADYALRGSPGFTASLLPAEPQVYATSPFYLEIRSAASGRTYWFRFDEGNGYSHASLIPISDPADFGENGPRDLPDEDARIPGSVLDDLAIYSLNGELDVLDAPSPEDEAPAFLFIPELGAAFWYEAPSMSEPPPPAEEREDMPRALFERTACGTD